jgi:PAS domain S-box-containing protein
MISASEQMVSSEWIPADASLWEESTPSETSILVVEDEGIVATDLGQRLERMGYHVAAIVGIGQDAIDQAQAQEPDLILMDIMLRGDMRGTQAAHIIRSEMEVPIVFLTVYSDDSTLREARLTQPYGYLLKPFDEDILKTTITVALYKHRTDVRMKEQRDWLDSVLNSVAEALITTDRLGRVTYMNSAAEGLTGWQQHQAKNRPLAEVFTLTNSETGRPIDSAVSNPFSSQTTTTLVSRSGQSIAIQHKASPLNDKEGHHNGYVVSFGIRS